MLDEVGGWAEWCITEDASWACASSERGYEASYVPHSYGRGLIPDTFAGLQKRRYRWAYGAMQILEGPFRALFPASAPPGWSSVSDITS